MISSPRRLLVLAAVLGSAFALTACEESVSIGDDSISASNLESETSKTLTAEVGEEPKAVSCPDDIKAEVGEKTTCELTDQRGNKYDANITITSVDDDGNAKFNIKVSDIKQMGNVPE